MNGHAVESGSHLTQAGIEAAKAVAHDEPAIKELDASKLTITRATAPRDVPAANSKEATNMKTCTDHMVKVTWTSDAGWHSPVIEQYGPLTMMPIASCLHYATQCFEGMKVYRGYDGKLRLFRPDKNCARLNMSSARVALPQFDTQELEKLMKAFLAIDGPKWLPKSRSGTFLYLRPAIIGNGEEIGVTAPAEVLLFMVAVLWPDFSTPGPGVKPGLKLLASKNDTRAWPGGFGYAKVGANYGPAFVAHMEGRKQGYDQILWLLGPEQHVTEAGASNFFVVWKTKEGALQLVTAPLEGKIILEGVTRGSVLDLARERLVKGSKYITSELGSIEIVERIFTMSELVEASNEGRLVEAFVAGTAYFITPISAINFRDEEFEIPMGDGSCGHYAALLKKWLGDIMYGNVDHEWGVVIDEE
ncbi:branched-chain amino acid aminotransferase II [Mollisia scopiformis]|uniref:Branched-chain-amino-acid aminotransferase n=1 Tax=Mollisia scopiformis TaxID=149040 RepID=A0A194XQ23_MOLSC|nr:branched-chain amino acid aminotransferase II [Mollisia scopiformis]KUJ22360.1 branched-chain amino acid aminotransferase II [Mollisia scopiformis]